MVRRYEAYAHHLELEEDALMPVNTGTIGGLITRDDHGGMVEDISVTVPVMDGVEGVRLTAEERASA